MRLKEFRKNIENLEQLFAYVSLFSIFNFYSLLILVIRCLVAEKMWEERIFFNLVHIEFRKTIEKLKQLYVNASLLSTSIV